MSEKPEKTSKNNILQFIFVFLFGIGLAGLILLLNKRPKPEMIRILPTQTQIPIVVQITGEVLKPGVYEFKSLSRVLDLVEAAGGFTVEADETAVNLASLLHDGQQVIIPSISAEIIPTDNQQDPIVENDPDYPININHCTTEELITLPGIGETKAEAIIQYREKYGDFEVKEDILKVSGIGDTIFESIKDMITVK